MFASFSSGLSHTPFTCVHLCYILTVDFLFREKKIFKSFSMLQERCLKAGQEFLFQKEPHLMA